MIKQFENKKEYPRFTINLVDDNGNFVGYDAETQCCEECNHRFVTTDGNAFCSVDYLPEEAVFGSVEGLGSKEVPKICRYGCDKEREGIMKNYNPLDRGNEIFFPIVIPAKEDKPEEFFCYLHIYNCQNGFYTHSWKSGIKEHELKYTGFL